MNKVIGFILFAILSTAVHGQVYRMNNTTNGQTINFTCPISGVRFADSGSGSSHYANGRDDTLTFCASVGKLLKFDFGCGSNLTNERIDPTDTLFIYNGASVNSPLLYAVTGNASNSDKLSYFDETSSFSFLASSRCITFRFKSSASNNNDGWDACVTCVDSISCGNNQPATDLFGGAPFICNTQGYCGNTSSDFGEDYPVNLNPNGGNCPSGLNFLGTIENNSWLKFIADSTAVVFDFSVATGGSCLNGIQTAIFSYNGSSLTRMSDCSLSDGSHSGNFQLTGTGLTIGDTYYIMTDGNAGDDCDFTINVSAGVNVLDAGSNQEVCAGDPVNLLASGPSGVTYVWNSTDGLVVNDSGAAQTYNPLVPTTYYVSIVGGGVCEEQIDTVIVNICAVLPVEMVYFDADCDAEQGGVVLSWMTNSELNNDYFEIEKAGHDMVFKSLGVVKGAGNSSVVQHYQYVDYSSSKGKAYYRIKQVDFNGYYDYSAVRSVNSCVTEEEISGVSITNDGLLMINYGVYENVKASLQVYDLQGKRIFNGEIELFSSERKNSVYLTGVISGAVYLIRIRIEDAVYVQKIMR
jgi:hypothetical protein